MADFEDFCADCRAVNFMFEINNQSNDNNYQIRYGETCSDLIIKTPDFVLVSFNCLNVLVSCCYCQL